MSREERNQRTLEAASDLDRLGRRAAHGSVISFAAHAGRMIVAIGGSAILARLLDPSYFGLIAMATTVTAFVGLFTDLGLSAATVQRHTISQSLISTLLLLNVAAGLGLMALAAALAPASAWFFDDQRLTLLTICLSLSIPITAAGAQHGALLARAMRWIPMQTSTLLGQAAGVIAAVLLIYFGDIGYWGLVVQQLVAATVSTVFLWMVCDWRPSFSANIRNAIDEIRFGAGLTTFSFINYFHRQLDNLLIGWRWGATELGYYNRAYNLFYAFQSFFSIPINSVLMPLLSRSKNDKAAWRDNFLHSVTVIAFGNGLIGTIFICCGSALVYILYGLRWGEAAEVLFRLAPTILISGNFALGTLFMARGDSRGLLRSAILNTILYALGFLIAVNHGAQSMAMAYSIVTAITVPLTVYLALKGDNISQFDYYRATLPFTLCGALIVAGWFWLVPDGNEPVAFSVLVMRTTLIGCAYLAVALCVLMWDPALASLRARIFGQLRGTRFQWITPK
jgi:PST family polysaccharide transporter